MKNIVVIIVAAFSTFAFSQSPILPLNAPYSQISHNAYLKDTQNQLAPFVGTWMYQQGNTKVTIKFKKIMTYLNVGNHPFYYVDVLNANYKVERNGVVVYDDLLQPIGDNSHLSGSFFTYGNKYDMTFVDSVKCDIWGDVKIWIGTNGKLNWEMYMSDPNPYSLDECPEALTEGFHDNMTLPYVMEMTKMGVVGN